MSNHADSPIEMQKIIDSLGATNRFPEGKLTKDDEGELRLAVTVLPEGKVVLQFGKPVAWIGFLPKQAAELGELLIQKSKEARIL